ncbi:MAG: V-type ATPase subunit [Candidatus Coatesbacteria bacterium]|nr:V-type ATPase subunit [Candidatus Coatesbacteria bacterium]
MGDSKYAYPTGALRAKENTIIDRHKINSLADAENEYALLNLLRETIYGDFITEETTPSSFENILSLTFQRECNFIKEITPEPNITNLFFLKYDFFNAKALMKSSILDVQTENLYKDIGLISIDDLKSYINEESKPKLNNALKETLDSIIKDKKNINLFEIETRLDKSYLHYALEQSDHYLLLKDFHKSWIDLTNICSFLRFKLDSDEIELFKYSFVYGGYLEKSVFLNLWKEEMLKSSDFSNRYKSLIETALEEYQKEKTLEIMEKGKDNFLLKKLQNAKYLSFAPEPFYAFLLARENEIKILRILFVGMINKMSREKIRKMLRVSYV